MRASRTKPSTGNDSAVSAKYRGKRTKTGNSSGFRFEGALFKSHPEFNGEVIAQIIAPGRMLVTAEDVRKETTDPVVASFLAFIAQDIATTPENVRQLDLNLKKRMEKLTRNIPVAPQEDIEDGPIL